MIQRVELAAVFDAVARLTLPCGLWMINSWKRVVSSLIIPWVVAI
jgi:hypothetical protein